MRRWLLLLILLTFPVSAEEVHDDPLGMPEPAIQKQERNPPLLVPHILFRERSEGLSILRRRGFQNLRLISTPTQTRSGVVLYVVPPAGQEVQPGERVTVFISKQRVKKAPKKLTAGPKREPLVTRTGFLGVPYWLMLQFVLLYLWIRAARYIDSQRQVGEITFVRFSAPLNESQGDKEA